MQEKLKLQGRLKSENHEEFLSQWRCLEREEGCLVAAAQVRRVHPALRHQQMRKQQPLEHQR